MAKELWARCGDCKSDFKIPYDEQRRIKIDQIVAGQEGGILEILCPRGHNLMLDSSDKSKVFVKGR